MSSSSSAIPKFDVFVSFSGEDTRNTFVSHLLDSLSVKGIAAYCRDEKLEKRFASLSLDPDLDPDIDRDLHLHRTKRIQESKVAVVVISASYVTSNSCLEDLQTILQSQMEGTLFVLPIFYKADLPQIRKQYFELAEQLQKLGVDYPAEKVQALRIALNKITNMSAIDPSLWTDENTMINLITNEILLIVSANNKPINPISTKESDFPGLDRQMQELYRLMDMKSNQEVRLIAILGPGGIGKTTLARYAFQEMSDDFHAQLFLDNAEEIYTQDIAEEIYTQDIGASQDKSSSSEEIPRRAAQTRTRSQIERTDGIKSKVGYKKSLLVIDSVDTMSQLKDIEDIVSWCGLGSRVILITDDKNLLDRYGVEHVYEVASLKYDEALQLFSESAFKQKHPPSRFEPLSLRAVQVARFLPLTIKILGSCLQGKSEDEWEMELQKIEGDQAKAIMEIMKKKHTKADDENKPSTSFAMSSK